MVCQKVHITNNSQILQFGCSMQRIVPLYRPMCRSNYCVYYRKIVTKNMKSDDKDADDVTAWY